jgi:hypothetical protein
MPGKGVGQGGLGHQHGICEGLGVSSLPFVLTLTDPIEIGNKQDQHISVIGFTNRPAQEFAEAFPIVTIMTMKTRKTLMSRP